ncbi:hypothetical protein BDN67DRAFT_966280 [Paxillus ammoniavirescens]|nr:hypothetical protein BDN67DRAFT_966280 [Paxillus ammoniavirescens]
MVVGVALNIKTSQRSLPKTFLNPNTATSSLPDNGQPLFRLTTSSSDIESLTASERVSRTLAILRSPTRISAGHDP